MKLPFLKYIFLTIITILLIEITRQSLSAIEKRKASIKTKILKDKGSDKELIEHAIKIGLL